MNDELGSRMKENYEYRTRNFLPRRTYTIIRLDGKAFHTYTKGLKRPFDNELMDDMDNAIIALMKEIQGAVFAYTQSDEVSILLTDFATPQTDAWFDGNLQKMTSVSASIMTAEFNRLRINRNRAHWNANNKNTEYPGNETLAYFDSRVFTIPDRIEVMNYFRWRQKDCIRNSVNMVAQSLFSHKELQGKNQSDVHEMLHQKGINWATDFNNKQKNGRLIQKHSIVTLHLPPRNPKGKPSHRIGEITSHTRNEWIALGADEFTKDEGKLLAMIPKYPDENNS